MKDFYKDSLTVLFRTVSFRRFLKQTAKTLLNNIIKFDLFKGMRWAFFHKNCLLKYYLNQQCVSKIEVLLL